MTVLPNVVTSMRWQPFNCPKYDKTCAKSLVKHSCWSAIILGLIMLALGIILRSSLVTKQSPTVTSSGLLFILIGVFIILMGPIAALYDVLSNHKSQIDVENPHEDMEGIGSSPRPSQALELPSYSEVMTGQKSPSVTYSTRYYPRILSAEVLSDSKPPPPSYDEIVANDRDIDERKNDSRRMTAP